MLVIFLNWKEYLKIYHDCIHLRPSCLVREHVICNLNYTTPEVRNENN